MTKLLISAAAASLLLLAGCGGKGDDKLGDQTEQAMDNKADAMDAAADNMTGPAKDAMEANADATREMGEQKEEAIDRSDVNADAMTAEQKAAVVNSN